MRRFLLALLFLSARSALAQQPTGPRVTPSSSIVRGVVTDSLAHSPLAGALVQLVSSESTAAFGRTEVADSTGAFAFADVPSGRYTIGFYHPMLDSLGIEPLLHAVTVSNQSVVRANLGIPGPDRLRASVCGDSPTQAAGAVVIGVVRDAHTGAPLADANVVGEWFDIAFGAGGMTRTLVRRVATTRETGWFALCNTPTSGTMSLLASRQADSTDVVEVQVPPFGFVRHELLLGAARTVTAPSLPTDSSRTDSIPLPPRRMHVGDGRLSGTVVSSVNGRPLVNAQVGIVNGPQTRTNERGQWTIVDAPPGTRALETRAVGYYPQRQTVVVADGAPPIRLALLTFQSVLDTLKVTANYSRYNDLAGFRNRLRTGMGRYVTSADIVRRRPIVVTDVLRGMLGLYFDSTSLDEQIQMKGVFSERCTPNVYLNSMLMNGLTAGEVDGLVSPKNILGIEVYSPTNAPPQFQPGLSGCGSIVIWSK